MRAMIADGVRVQTIVTSPPYWGGLRDYGHESQLGMERLGWPMWARSAWARGWIQQPSSRQLTKQIVQGFVDESVRRGVPLRVTVDRFLDSGKGGEA